MGGGLAGLSTAVELLDQGYEVDIYEQRPFIGGKVGSSCGLNHPLLAFSTQQLVSFCQHLIMRMCTPQC